MSRGLNPTMLRSANSIWPRSGASCPLIMLKQVDFPAPLGPISARNSPSPTSKLTSSTACTPPKAFDRLRTRSTLMSAFSAPPSACSARRRCHPGTPAPAAASPRRAGRARTRSGAQGIADGRKKKATKAETPGARDRRGKEKKGGRAVERCLRPDAENAVGTAGDVLPLEQDRPHDLREGEREHRQVDAGEPH